MNFDKIKGRIRYCLIVKTGYSIYRGSVFLVNIGTRIRFFPLVSIGKFGREIALRFPAK
ncbi:MAG: hypothetical protein LBI67_05565 [Treponema sp.]|nr:hypothetical protein [Treponema sp.]